MSRKDFVLIASTIRIAFSRVRTAEQQQGVLQVALDMADDLRSTNPNFNRSRFLDAAVPPPLRETVQ
jgi:hypothetical protein